MENALRAAELKAQTAPIRKVSLGPADATFTRREDGAILIRSPHALPTYHDKLTWHLSHWASAAPERTFIAQRDADGDWRTLNYAQTLKQVRAIGQALIDKIGRASCRERV